MNKTKDEAKLTRTAKYVFSQNQTLDFLTIGENLARNKEIIRHNRKVRQLQELAEEFNCMTKEIKELKQKDTIL